MKLLTRTTLLYIAVTLVVFVAGAFIFYYFLQSLVKEEATESLMARKEMILEELARNTTLTNSPLAPGVNIEPAGGPVTEYVTDTFMFDHHHEEVLPYRVLKFGMIRNGQAYKVTIQEAMLEQDDLVEGIFYSFIAILIVLAITVIGVTQFASKKMWKPFFTSLRSMQEYKPGLNRKIQLPESGIREFRELNEAIEQMTRNTESAFLSLKSFSENAAHEIQTPLAAIRSSTEILQQDAGLSEEQNKTIAHIHNTATQLSAMVSTLLLMTRIENRMYLQEDPVDVSEIARQKTALFGELFTDRGIHLETKIENGVLLPLPRVLTEILVSNLLSNAVKHTPAGGTAYLGLMQEKLEVRNSGTPLKGDPSRIFERFYKEDMSEKSTGLGLSLVKMIADSYQLNINYRYESNQHIFTVTF